MYKHNEIRKSYYFLFHSPNSKPLKWAENVCFTLIVILNLSTWIDLNSVWIELPLIVNTAPEHWTLPSTLSLIISLANIFPVIVVIVRWILGERFSEIPFIYVIITVGVIACFSIGLFWNYTAYIFGAERSYALIIAVFALGLFTYDVIDFWTPLPLYVITCPNASPSK